MFTEVTAAVSRFTAILCCCRARMDDILCCCCRSDTQVDIKTIDKKYKPSEIKLSGPKYCIICFENLKSIVFIPCLHLAVCAKCSNKLKPSLKCPICRQSIYETINVAKLQLNKKKGFSDSIDNDADIYSNTLIDFVQGINTCEICDKNIKTNFFVPCSHFVLCNSCLQNRLKSRNPTCPMCNTIIRRAIQIDNVKIS